MKFRATDGTVADLDGESGLERFSEALAKKGKRRFPSEHFKGKSTLEVEKVGELMLMATVTVPR